MPGLIRCLKEVDHESEAAATEATFRFNPGETLSITAGNLIHTDRTWWEHSGRVEHVTLARWADLVHIAPATADSMARAVIGLGGDLNSATILGGTKKILWAPAMNPEMWQSSATKRDVETLKSWRASLRHSGRGAHGLRRGGAEGRAVTEGAEIAAALEEASRAGEA